MARPLTSLRERARTPTGIKARRYTLVSVISVVVAQISLIIAYGGLHWTARASAVFATCIGTIPSYYLNRNWVWGRSGRSHLWKELVPFWVLAFIGLAFSTFTSDTAERYVTDHDMSRLLKTAIVAAAYFGAFAVLWVGKFVIFNKILFVSREEATS